MKDDDDNDDDDDEKYPICSPHFEVERTFVVIWVFVKSSGSDSYTYKEGLYKTIRCHEIIENTLISDAQWLKILTVSLVIKSKTLLVSKPNFAHNHEPVLSFCPYNLLL